MEKDVLDRLVAEQEELRTRKVKLDVFIGSDKFNSLGEENQFLLKAQVNAMGIYNEVLIRRIEINSNKAH